MVSDSAHIVTEDGTGRATNRFERMPGRQNHRGPPTFQPAHRPQPGFEPAVITLDRVVRILPSDVQGGRQQLVEDPRVGRGPGRW